MKFSSSKLTCNNVVPGFCFSIKYTTDMLTQGGKAAFTRVGCAFFEPHQEHLRLTQGCSPLTKVACTHYLQFFYEHLG